MSLSIYLPVSVRQSVSLQHVDEATDGRHVGCLVMVVFGCGGRLQMWLVGVDGKAREAGGEWLLCWMSHAFVAIVQV